jgi:hypothetical protein
MKAKTVLNDEYWTEFKSQASSMNLTRTVEVMSVVNISDFTNFTALHYGDVGILSHLEPMTVAQRASVTLMEMGSAFERIASILLAEYDPLENYFTDRDMTTTYDLDNTKSGTETNTRSGKETVTPSGSVTSTDSGITERSTDGSNAVSQGTTYDNAGFSPEATDEFRNIGKTINNVTEKEGSDPQNPRKSTTSYQNFKTEREYSNLQDQKTFGNRVDSTDGTVSIDESRSGNSGIFAKQDLIQREIRLRLNNRIIPIMVRMVVDAINSGVWEDDDTLL